jgi:hypothetical protein
VSVEFTPTMMVRKRTVWLTDNPGAMVEDFDRVSRRAVPDGWSCGCTRSKTGTAPARRVMPALVTQFHFGSSSQCYI